MPDHNFESAASELLLRAGLVNGAVSYICNGGELNRYTNYNFTNVAQPATAAALLALPGGATETLMADNVTACTFTYTPGESQRAGLVTIDLTINDAAEPSEQIRLLHQVHVVNVP